MLLIDGTVLFVRFDDLVLGLRRLGARFGALDLHLEALVLGGRVLDMHLGSGLSLGGLRSARTRRGRHVGDLHLVGLLYVRIQVDDEVADAYVPLVVIVLEVGRGVGGGLVCWLRRGVP